MKITIKNTFKFFILWEYIFKDTSIKDMLDMHPFNINSNNNYCYTIVKKIKPIFLKDKLPLHQLTYQNTTLKALLED